MPTLTRRSFLLLIAPLFFASLLVPVPRALLVEVDGTQYFLLAGSNNISVVIEYTHSVELFKVLEVYEISGCEIRLVSYEWPGYGAGLGSTASDYAWLNESISGGYYTFPELFVDLRYRFNSRVVVGSLEVREAHTLLVKPCTPVSLLKLIYTYLNNRVVVNGLVTR